MRETHRILREMTARLRERAEDIGAALAVITELDAAFARGGFAYDFDCTMPEVGTDRPGVEETLVIRCCKMWLRKKGTKVIPLSLSLDSENRVARD